MCVCYACTYLEPCLVYKVEAGRHHAVVEGDNELLESLGEGVRQSVEPGGEERVPAQHLWLHVDHATPRHLNRGRERERGRHTHREGPGEWGT